MLYVTTRNDRDAFTPLYAMTHDCSPDGGQFLPMQVPQFGEEALREIAARSFNENVAQILSLLFRRSLSGWDLDLNIGKNPLQLQMLNSHTLMAQLRFNPEWSFEELTRRIFRLLEKDAQMEPAGWFTMSVRIAMLFGIFGELMARELVSAEHPMDVSVPSFDFQYPMALWYVKQWGLPVGNIIICCNENNAPWSLLHQGEMRTDTPIRETLTAACDQAVPAGLERLIAAKLNGEELQRYVRTVDQRRPFALGPEQLEQLRSGFWVSVVSQRRMRFMLPNLCPTDAQILDPYTVMSYAGLVDHRSQSGETGLALIISEEEPIHGADILSSVLGVSEEEIRRRLAQQ